MGIEEFMQEAQVMKKLKHPNLVTLIGVCSTDMPMLIVTEFIPHGDMLTYLRRREAKAEMTQRAMLYVCAQVADGMAYLEVSCTGLLTDMVTYGFAHPNRCIGSCTTVFIAISRLGTALSPTIW